MCYKKTTLVTILLLTMIGCNTTNEEDPYRNLLIKLNNKPSPYGRREYETLASDYNQNSIPRYNYSEDLPFHSKALKHPKKSRIYTGVYPRYDPDADNPYYPEQVYRPFDRKVYQGFYPTPPPNTYNYKYPTYNSNADNPYQPPVPDNTQFDKPLFDKPLFKN